MSGWNYRASVSGRGATNPLLNTPHWYVSSVRPCTSTPFKESSNLKNFFFFFLNLKASAQCCSKKKSEKSEYLRLIMNLAVRHDTCSGLLSIPPGVHCQQEHFIHTLCPYIQEARHAGDGAIFICTADIV